MELPMRAVAGRGPVWALTRRRRIGYQGYEPAPHPPMLQSLAEKGVTPTFWFDSSSQIGYTWVLLLT
jgi:hypothetical protein